MSHKAYRQYTDLMNRVENGQEREKKQKAREEEAQRKAQEAAAQENQKLPPKGKRGDTSGRGIYPKDTGMQRCDSGGRFLQKFPELKCL